MAHDGFVMRRRGSRCMGNEECVCVCVLSASLLGKCKDIAERWSDRETRSLSYFHLRWPTTQQTVLGLRTASNYDVWILKRAGSHRKKGRGALLFMPFIWFNCVLSHAYQIDFNWNLLKVKHHSIYWSKNTAVEKWTPVCETHGTSVWLLGEGLYDNVCYWHSVFKDVTHWTHKTKIQTFVVILCF